MDDGVERRTVSLEPSFQLFGCNQVTQFELADVAPFVPGSQAIADRDPYALFGHGRGEVGTDKAGSPGDHHHRDAISCNRTKSLYITIKDLRRRRPPPKVSGKLAARGLRGLFLTCAESWGQLPSGTSFRF